MGTVSGLQPKSLDLTQFARARAGDTTLGDVPVRVSAEVAAGALAFAAGPVKIDGDWYQGDEFLGLLLRLKEGRQISLGLFRRAHRILCFRHGEELAGSSCQTAEAIAAGALFEWVHDRCPECRGARQGARRPQACDLCFPPLPAGKKVHGRRALVEFVSKATGKIVSRMAAVPSPKPGCRRCGGSGRIFKEPKERRGLRCGTCKNAGRIEFSTIERWKFVNDYLRVARRANGGIAAGINRTAFKAWVGRYCAFVEKLRDYEKTLGAGLDLGKKASTIGRTESVRASK
jgi:hypothetical protein